MAQSSESSPNEEVLEVFDAPESQASQVFTFETSELTALCPYDFGGPDYYDLTLRYKPDKVCIESRSLKKYIESFRDCEITAEDIGAAMYEAFESLMDPKSMYLRLEQTRRGGIEETVEFGDQSLRLT